MLIVCPSCASRYSIDDDKIGSAGRTVRCASCRAGFFVGPAGPAVVAPPALIAGEKAPASPAPAEPSPPSADDDLAAQWLAEMERDGTPLTDTDMTDPTPQPTDLDQAALDNLFEAEMAAARAEADAAAGAALGMDGTALDGPVPTKGWRRFLPGKHRTPVDTVSDGEVPRPTATHPPAKRRGPRPAARKDRTSKPAMLPMARLKGPLGLGLGGALVLAGAVFLRQQVVMLVPSSAALFSAINLPVNLKGLEFADIRSMSQTEGEARFLLVEGGVRSVHRDTVAVPLIEIRLRGEDGRTLYTWTAEPPRKSLRPGEALHFRTRLATPPEAGRHVEVRFTDKLQNAKAGS